jgi:hypothetical protein
MPHEPGDTSPADTAAAAAAAAALTHFGTPPHVAIAALQNALYPALSAHAMIPVDEPVIAHVPVRKHPRPWACEHCGKDFVSRADCVVHVRSHTGERPFGCDLCDKRFNKQGRTTLLHFHT